MQTLGQIKQEDPKIYQGLIDQANLRGITVTDNTTLEELVNMAHDSDCMPKYIAYAANRIRESKTQNRRR